MGSMVHQPLVASLSCVFFSFPGRVDGLRKQFINNSVFPLGPVLLALIIISVRSLVGMFLPLFLGSRSGDMQWFDACCRRAYDAKQTAYDTRCEARNADHCGRFLLARAEAHRVNAAAR